jgi:UDP-glucose 4-epimerase
MASKKKKKRVLVTGGLGYIGSHTVVELVNAGFEPVIIDDLSNSYDWILPRIEELTHQSILFRKLNVCSRPELSSCIKELGPFDGIIHFAAFKAVGESVQEPLKYFENNVSGMIEILAAIHREKIPALVFSSSCTVYGSPATIPVTEESPILPAFSPYGRTKQIGEYMILDTLPSCAVSRAVLLRYFNPIGAHPSARLGELPRGVPNNLIPFVTQTAAGIRDELVIHGDTYPTKDGTCIRDYIHVVDLAESHVAALTFALDKLEPRAVDVFNVGTGNGNSVREVVSTFQAATGVSLKHRVGPIRVGDVPAIYADVSKSAEKLGWRATRSLEQSLVDSWRWQLTLGDHQS